MKRLVRPAFLLFPLALATLSFSLVSCTVKTGICITKVNPYHLRPGVSYANSEEEMIEFEYRRKIRGAVNAQDYHDRYGDYFTVYWKTDCRDEPVTIRLEYRQAETGPKTFAMEKVCDAPRRNNTTNFEIIGCDYAERGEVTQWKASVIQNEVVVDEFKSFLWQ